jgi:hypothetical protein
MCTFTQRDLSLHQVSFLPKDLVGAAKTKLRSGQRDDNSLAQSSIPSQLMQAYSNIKLIQDVPIGPNVSF